MLASSLYGLYFFANNLFIFIMTEKSPEHGDVGDFKDAAVTVNTVRSVTITFLFIIQILLYVIAGLHVKTIIRHYFLFCKKRNSYRR